MGAVSNAHAAKQNGKQNGMHQDKALNETFGALPSTIFTVMTNLANEHGSINLGQGFPDDEGPTSMKVSQ